MKTFSRALAGLLLALGLSAQAAEIRVEPRVQVSTGAVAKAKAAHARATHVKAIVLPPVGAVAKSTEAALPGMPLKIGSGREIPELEFDAVATLTWDDNGSSKVAALSVTSPGAKALRAGLRIYSMPAEAVLRFYSPADSELIEVTGAEVLATLARNDAAGDHGESGHTFWSPSIEAETIVMEIELPAGTPVASLKVGVPYVTHMTTSVKWAYVSPYQSAACEIDATCSMGTWGSQMNAVAHVQFQIGSGGYICTGTLMADQDVSSTIPYFLTANHCISSTTVASSVETWWFYRSASCNSTTLNNAQRLMGGATLLYASAQTDTSFLRLNNAPPAGAVFAGWTVTTASIGAAATGIHHPRGDMEKISFGSVRGHWTCTAATGGMFNCSQANALNGTFYELQWNAGITEPGSSGSGVFLDNGRYLVGQLYGGSSSCTQTNPPGSEFYGRLDVAYNARLSTWLGATAQPTLTVAKAGTGAGTVTSLPSGIDCGATCSGNFPANGNIVLTVTPSVGSTFTSWSGACTGTSPSCIVVLASSTTATATFTAAPPQTLTVSRVGSGTITTNPAAINCGTTCTSTFPAGSAVTLTATPASGQIFAGWTGGACAGTGQCTVTMNGPINVTGTFAVNTAPSIAITLAGNGSGLVMASNWSLYCGTLCSANYAAGTVITLSASANAGSTFAGWGGACSGTSPSCTLTVNGPRAVTANFNNGTAPPPPPPPPTQQVLTITSSGTGTGTVTSNPAGINCGATCSANFNTGTSVTLTATPASGSTFTGWSGACSGTAACVLAMNAANTATATFTATVTPPPPTTQTLTVSSSGTGSGTIISNPAGISCAGCSAPFTTGTVVTLTVAPTSGSSFAGWTGACTGTAPCVVTMNAATSVQATFTLNPPPPPPVGPPSITVTRAGNGNGTVMASNWSIYCGTLCTANYAAGTSITLSANANAGSTFAGWGGACAASGTSASCTVSVTGALAVTASFNSGTAPPPPPPPPPTQQALTVTSAGTGTGTVTSSTGGINCGATCSANFATGTMVTLTATPASGSTFTGWSGACSGTSTCTLTMNAAASATATFTATVTPPPPPPPPTGTPSITLTRTGNGSGLIMATNWSLYCGTLCTANYAAGTVITLNASSNAGSRFIGWSGACSGTATSCTVTVNSGLAVSANFVTP